MVVQLRLRQLDVPPGHRVLLHDVSWQEFEAILDELGDRRSTRLAYYKGILEIVSPLIEGISQFLEMSRTAGTRPALKAFRQWVREHPLT